jgi:hypothetical protein
MAKSIAQTIRKRGQPLIGNRSAAILLDGRLMGVDLSRAIQKLVQ